MVCHGSHQYTPFMLAYMPAPWIRHGIGNNRKKIHQLPWCKNPFRVYHPSFQVMQIQTQSQLKISHVLLSLLSPLYHLHYHLHYHLPLQTQSARCSMQFSCIFHASISNPLDPTHDQADTPRPWHASPWCLGCWVCQTDASPDVGWPL